MRISPLFLLFPFLAFAQNTPPTFDGVVNPEEWISAEKHTIEYEISPGNNTPSPVATEAFLFESLESTTTSTKPFFTSHYSNGISTHSLFFISVEPMGILELIISHVFLSITLRFT